MTSDAKVGLLLGLSFIFIIAFIINGVPRFGQEQNNNELTTNMVSSDNNSVGIGSNARKVSRTISAQEVRFRSALPKSEPKTEVIDVPSVSVSAAAVLKEDTSNEREQSKTIGERIYMVRDGDNLALIAKEVYGEEIGNTHAVIKTVFEANREVLKSADEVYVGQRLIMPVLSSSSTLRKGGDSAIFNKSVKSVFEKVGSIGKRHEFSTRSEKKSAERRYVVKEGDSLWSIAARQLGDGGCYRDIVRLNADVLEDEDKLSVGMSLKLPAK